MKGLRNCLRRGLGLTLCPRAAIRHDLEAGRLTALPWIGFGDDNYESVGPRKDSQQQAAAHDGGPYDVMEHEAAVVMIWHQDKWCSPLLRRFMDMAGEEMARDGKPA